MFLLVVLSIIRRIGALYDELFLVRRSTLLNVMFSNGLVIHI